jgi:isopenicillin-N N-acyltransferase-like protein
MSQRISRRTAIGTSAAAIAGIVLPRHAVCQTTWPTVPEHALTTVSGSPRDRGRQYGKLFAAEIARFLETEILTPFDQNTTRDEMLRFAGQCAQKIRTYSPEAIDELEGIAEGSELRLEDVVAITLHEEYYHQGILPKADHCTAVAAGPPDTSDQHTYVGQTWDWFVSLYGASQMLLWRRAAGPSVLAYAYPGLWVGAGLNSQGIALCWTSAEGHGVHGPRIGIPSYVLIAQMLYQETLDDALAEARRAHHAGWFTFVLADSHGRLVNVEGSPKELAIEEHHGHLARVYFGSREMTRTPAGQSVTYHPRCQLMYDLLGRSKGSLNAMRLRELFGDQSICSCSATNESRAVRTIDAMVFDTTSREAFVTRGPIGSRPWSRFGFGIAREDAG